MNSILDFELTHGTFLATIDYYKEVPAIIDDNNTIIRDAYLAVTLRLNNNETIKTRWYSKRIPYILRCLRTQLGEHIYKLTDALNIASTTPFTVHITIDSKYGQQIEYSKEEVI